MQIILQFLNLLNSGNLVHQIFDDFVFDVGVKGFQVIVVLLECVSLLEEGAELQVQVKDFPKLVLVEQTLGSHIPGGRLV